MLQYQYHHWFANDYSEQIANLLEQISLAEMLHIDLLGRAMKQLGLDRVAPITKKKASAAEKTAFAGGIFMLFWIAAVLLIFFAAMSEVF